MFDDIFNTLASRSGKDSESEAPFEEVSEAMPLQTVPPDLSERIGLWLDSALSLAESCSIAPVAAQLKALDARNRLPGFRLAFVGEFNRGKSTLINRLLNRRLLPVGVLPTTDTITAIMAGPEEQMEIRFPNGHQEIRSLQEASWSDLVVNEQTGKPQEVFPHIRLTLSNQWLQELDVEIIDTPGVGDLNDHRTALVSDVLSQSDAAVLLVSAVLPFSLTEAAFLEQEVLGRHIPLVLVVISMLDTLSEDQQSVVLQAVRDRVAQVSSFIPVFPAHPVDASMTEAEAIDTVRSQIKALVSKADRHVWRSRQVAEAITDHLATLIDVGQTAIAAAQMDAAKLAEAQRKMREEARSSALLWEKLSLELDQRRLRVDQKLRQRLREARDNVVRTVSSELANTSDLKSWWEKKFPNRLHQEFLVLAQGFEAFLIDSLAQDVRWLQDEIKHLFGTHVSQGPMSVIGPLEPAPHRRNIVLADIERQRLFTRMGCGAAMVAGYVLIGPIGGAISIATGILGEYYLKGKLEEQRRQLKNEIERSIDRATEEYSGLLSERLHHLYSQIAQDMKREQAIWEEARNTALTIDTDAADSKSWQRLINEASTLQSDIITSIKS